MIFSNGDKYEGDWSDDEFNGNGKIFNKKSLKII